MPARNRTQIITGDNDCFLLLRIITIYLQYCLQVVPQDNVESADHNMPEVDCQIAPLTRSKRTTVRVWPAGL
jgi:hypothetical protein